VLQVQCEELNNRSKTNTCRFVQLQEWVGSLEGVITENTMKFSAFMRDEALERGAEVRRATHSQMTRLTLTSGFKALEATLPFNQAQVLEDNTPYLLAALQVLSNLNGSLHSSHHHSLHAAGRHSNI
jgi:hypothetical protein